MAQLLLDEVAGPLGKFRVSTIRTVAGGGDNTPVPIMGIPFLTIRPSDYENYNAWPFETMVFPENSSRGLYHSPYATEEEARAGHKLMVQTILSGTEFGGGVDDTPAGNPTMTPEQWRERMSVSK